MGRILRLLIEIIAKIVLVMTFLIVWGERLPKGNYVFYALQVVMWIWIFISIEDCIKKKGVYSPKI